MSRPPVLRRLLAVTALLGAVTGAGTGQAAQASGAQVGAAQASGAQVGAAQASGAQASGAQASAEGDLAAAVKQLQAKIDAGATRLEAATLRWEQGRAALDRSLQTDLTAGFTLEAQRARIDAAQSELDAFANSAYRQPINPGVIGLFRGNLMALHEYHVVQRGLNASAADQRAALKTLLETRATQEVLVASTGERAANAQREQVRLDAELAALQAQAIADGAELALAAKALEVKRLELLREQAARDRELSRYVLLPYNGTCGALPGETFANGFLPASALCPLRDAPGHALQPAAAAAFDQLSAAYEAALGTTLCVTDSYRSYAAQVDVFARKPGLAATPGRSNHGLGLAVDFCGGIQAFGSPAHQWMQANAPSFGWIHPAWAEPGGSKPEAWHWEFVGA